jgi:Bacterial SH3 domain
MFNSHQDHGHMTHTQSTIAISFLALVLLLLLTAAAPVQTVLTGTVSRNANLRAGPGTNYAIVGSVAAGDEVVVVSTNQAGDWYKLSNGRWIAAFLVHLDRTPGTAATITPRATLTPKPSATVPIWGSPTPNPLGSSGLGKPQSWWDSMKSYVYSEPGTMTVDYSHFDVSFVDGKAAHIELLFDPPVSISQASFVSTFLLSPRDTVHLGTEVVGDREHRMVWLMQSATLAKQFRSAVWAGGKPGRFAQIYDINERGDRVVRLTVAIGDYR